jgi:predicted amidohydrolase
MIDQWRATCIQVASEGVADAPDQPAAWTIIERNIARAVDAITAACDSHEPPKLALMPEFVFTGGPRHNGVTEWLAKAGYPIPGPITAPFQALAQAKNIYIGGNLFETDPDWPGRYFNTCFLVAPSGEIVLRFRRINTATFPSPHDFRDSYVAHYGEEGTFPVADTELGRIAMVACGEIAIPEVSRVLMMRGAEIILHPTNENYTPGQEGAKVARAAENMVYLISANVAGGIGFSADGSEIGGRSRILDFRGKTLAYEDGIEDSNAASAVIDMTALRDARRDPGMGNLLLRTRWDMYRSYYANIDIYPSNQFAAAPMQDLKSLEPIVKVALGNLERAGIVR